MSALGGGFNRSTQHSISFFLLGFESQGLAHTASDPKVPRFLCRSEASKKPSTFRHTLRLSPSRRRVLRRPVEPAVISRHDRTSALPPKADICSYGRNVRFVPIAAVSSAYSISSSARAMSFTNGCILICINAVARKHKRDVLATPQHECLKCEYTFWQQSPRLALGLAEPSVPRQCQ